MSLILRSGLGRKLTPSELDGNFTYLESIATQNSTQSFSNSDIEDKTQADGFSVSYTTLKGETQLPQFDGDFLVNFVTSGFTASASDINGSLILKPSEGYIGNPVNVVAFGEKYEWSSGEYAIGGGTTLSQYSVGFKGFIYDKDSSNSSPQHTTLFFNKTVNTDGSLVLERFNMFSDGERFEYEYNNYGGVNGKEHEHILKGENVGFSLESFISLDSGTVSITYSTNRFKNINL